MPEPVEAYREIADRFTAYAEAHIPGAKNLRITAMNRIHGGASRETYSVDIAYEDATGPKTRGLILRKDPPDSLIDTERRIEFAAIRTAFGKADIPAPEALFLETDPGPLGAPFFVMGRIEDGLALNPFRIEDVEPHRADVGRAFFRHLGAIASLDIDGAPIQDETDTPPADGCWKRELDYWANEIETNAREPQPVAQAAIRYLRRNPPPPAQKLSLVHGDYRSGNFLHDGHGSINAILDWEMAHIGDPYEDLAWATDLLWCGNDTERAAGFLPWEEAIATWQEASGCTFDPAAFEWWSLFAHLKGLGIWITSARAFADGKNDDPILAWSGWFTHCAHELMLASRLARKHGVEI
ncbi:phosphotransferase family protein [Henriciella sp.]|uniref:phosphotransferase family protein n=1 Tax=Henriciella sp. TaxID=1968823 RepID=UPI00261EB993|nr:phosphotransferase family protein [Henriciella sp.]